MADAKQVYLAGAYYGPPVPPYSTYQSMGGRRGSGCGPYCLLSAFFKLLFSVAILLVLLLFVIWLVFRPNTIQVHVESATLNRFNLTDDDTVLNYDLAFDISVRNPNRRIGFYYDHVEARAIYDGYGFGYDVLPTFYQDCKNSTVLRAAFNGSAGAFRPVSGRFGREKREGNFYVEVKIYTSVRLKVKFVKIGHFKPKFDCLARLVVPSNDSSMAILFELSKCDVDLF